MITRMDDVITTAFSPVIGLPCWGAVRVHGSIVSLEFGIPHLIVREPRVSTAASVQVRQRAAERLVKPVGEWNLTVFACHWHIVLTGDELANDDSSHEQIEAATRRLNGQKMTMVALDAVARKTAFTFDLGATLTTWPYEADDDEQWSLYQPGRRVLTYRADGCYSSGRGDEKPDQEVWHPLACSVCFRSQISDMGGKQALAPPLSS